MNRKPTPWRGWKNQRARASAICPMRWATAARARCNVCELEGMTSLLVPDPAHLALFNLFPIWGTVKSQIPVTTRKLDDIAEIAHLDFLKMDVQGAEREVLAHGRAKLARAVVIQTEVSFVPLYQGQPVFGEMDLALAGTGFSAPLRHRHQDLADRAHGGGRRAQPRHPPAAGNRHGLCPGFQPSRKI